MKQLDLARSVRDLTTDYPELIDIMVGLGFAEVANPAMRASVGRIMTLPKGAHVKGISLDKVIDACRAHGFEVVGAGVPSDQEQACSCSHEGCACGAGQGEESGQGSEDRVGELKGFLRRLGDGEDLEAVRADFAARFDGVEASEIMAAEQGLMDDGVPLEEVQRLCDLHSALFHGATAGEHPGTHPVPGDDDARRAAELAATKGHPLSTLTRENAALSEEIASARRALEEGSDAGIHEALVGLREVSVHYAKKGDLIFPLLATRYGITGPSNVMWTIDDEIRDEIGKLAKQKSPDRARVSAVLDRAEEMIYKEENILFPLCAAHFSDDEWRQLYRDSRDYAACFGVDPVWPDVDRASQGTAAPGAPGASLGATGLTVTMPGGSLTLEQLTALLNTIPAEITFVDAEDINRYFNEGPKDFKRPLMALGREVFSCHPPKVEKMVRAIIDGFRAGTSDEVSRWATKNGKEMYVSYLAVRDASGAYLGTLELVQDMEFARKHFSDR